MKSPEDVSRAVEVYADMVRRICLVHLKNMHDTEDVFQDVFLKYMLYKGSFENAEHEKAWFVRVTINACTDWLRNLSRRRWLPLEDVLEESGFQDEVSREVLEAVLQLPEKYRKVIYLFYYEGYSAVEIAGILGKKENTIYTWLSRGKAVLREELAGVLCGADFRNTGAGRIAQARGSLEEKPPRAGRGSGTQTQEQIREKQQACGSGESREVSGHELDS